MIASLDTYRMMHTRRLFRAESELSDRVHEYKVASNAGKLTRPMSVNIWCLGSLHLAQRDCRQAIQERLL